MPITQPMPRGLVAACGILILALTACGSPVPVEGQITATAEAPLSASDIPPPRTPIPTISPQRPATSSDSRLPIIWDDDGSPDGVIALLYFLLHPQIEVRALTVSCGEAHPRIFAANLERMLAYLGREDIPVGAGRDTPLSGSNAFPESWRTPTDDFWGIGLPDNPDPSPELSAAQLIVETVNASPEPVTIFVSGSFTNLAEALRLDPRIKENIASVQIMGGAVYVSGNLHEGGLGLDNQAAEWNIWIDPVAAQEVFASGLRMTITPLDATNQVLWTGEDARAWTQTGNLESMIARDIHLWTLRGFGTSEVYVWDLVAAVNAVDDDLCQHSALHLDVVVEQGLMQGATVVDDSASPNSQVCLVPDGEGIKQAVLDVFIGSSAAEQDPDALAGDWAGTIRSSSDDFSARIEESFDAGCALGSVCGTFILPEIGCAGELVLDHFEGDVLVFAERVTESMGGSCLIGGIQFLRLQSDGSLSYRYSVVLPTGEVNSIGVLYRQ